MSRNHGKNTVIIIDGDTLTTRIKNSGLDQTTDTEDVTCYGVDDKEYDVSLRDGKFKMDGVYDTATTGPKKVLERIIDAKEAVTLIRRIEGTGSGKPQESFSVIVENYSETAPSSGYVMWSADMQKTGPITRTTQP